MVSSLVGRRGLAPAQLVGILAGVIVVALLIWLLVRPPEGPCQDGWLECTKVYHATATPIESVAASDSIDAYYDYSLGMGEGMQATDQLNAALKNFLVGRTVRYWKVGAPIDPVQIDITARTADLQNLDNFKDPGSNLESTIRRIVAAPTRSAVFITDFERVDSTAKRVTHVGAPGPHAIETSAWAQVPFRQWLAQGHRIDVFAHRYQKPDYRFGSPAPVLDNWIYTLVFTPGPILQDSLRLKTSVLTFLLEEHAKRQSPDFRHFAFRADAFEVKARNEVSTGNVNVNIPVQEWDTLSTHPPVDYHDLNQEDLFEFVNDQSLTDKRVFDGVAITAAVPFLTNVLFDLKVSDVTAPIARLDSARTQPPPQFEVDPATGDSTPVGPPPIPEMPLLPAAPQDRVFKLVYNTDTKVVGLELHPDFAGVGAPTVFRVDIMIKSADLIDFTEIDQVTALNYRGPYRIRALGESLRLASRDLATAMIGKVVYTSYVKINP